MSPLNLGDGEFTSGRAGQGRVTNSFDIEALGNVISCELTFLALEYYNGS